MTSARDFHRAVGLRLREVREERGIKSDEIDAYFLLAPGWTESFEKGLPLPKELLLPVLKFLCVEVSDFFAPLPISDGSAIARTFYAEPDGSDLKLKFPYGTYDSEYILSNAKLEQYDEVLQTLQSWLRSSKREAAVQTFLKAVELWPHANPSDLWWFLISRAYQDILNHPAENAGLNLEQSWKRTGGWALEEIVVRFYKSYLQRHGISIAISNDKERSKIVENLSISDRLEADKIDVTLHGKHNGDWVFFGVVHVKASFAERRTDDIHMSSLLKGAGYTSPLWTMDCKSTPSPNPKNRGELGNPNTGARSAKRKDIEDEGYFTRCFSYNSNTIPSPATLPADRRVYVENFSSPDDQFSNFIIQRWRSFMNS